MTNINKTFLSGLKLHTIREENLNEVAESFPIILANFLQMILVKFSSGHVVNLKFQIDTYKKFVEDFEKCILNKDFDYFDNIVLQLLESYHYQVPPYVITIDFNTDQKEKFIETCNGFKGKEWNDILSSFIDALYNLLSTSSIQGGDLYLGVSTWR